MMVKILLAAIWVISSCSAYSQNSPTIQWQKSLGGTGADNARCVQQTDDGGYIVAGDTQSNNGDVSGNHGNTDFWLVKLDTSGTIQWQHSYGGADYDHAYTVRQTPDGGYVAAGSSFSTDGDVTGNHGGVDYWVVKLDNLGALQWQRSLGGTAEDLGECLALTADSGYILCGESRSVDGDVTGNHGGGDYWVVKLDNSGTIQWQKALGGSGNDEAHSIQQTYDGGYIVSGTSGSNDGDVTGNHGGSDYWVVKLDANGDLEWQKSLGGAADEYASSIQQRDDGGYFAAGTSLSNNGDVSGNHGGFDLWVVKLDGSGTIQWQKALGETQDDWLSDLHETTNHGLIVTGEVESDGGDVSDYHGGQYDAWVVKLDGEGTVLW